MIPAEKSYTVITGASSGIGRETAKAFAARGRNLVIAARRKSRLARLKAEIAGSWPSLDVVIRETDLSEPKNTYAFYDSLKGYGIDTWINNAGFGYYGNAEQQDFRSMEAMIRLNAEAVMLLSSLYVRDSFGKEGSQLINVSSAGGYTVVPTAVCYCATKFFVTVYTEGLARELHARGAKLRAKVLAPAATETEFGMTANGAPSYDYGKAFGTFHTARQMAAFLLELYDSGCTVGAVDRERFTFRLSGPLLPYAGASTHNQAARDIL